MIERLTYNVTEVARLLGYSRWTVNEMCRRFELHWIPRGRKGKKISHAEVLRWIRENEVSNAEELKKAMDGRRQK